MILQNSELLNECYVKSGTVWFLGASLHGLVTVRPRCLLWPVTSAAAEDTLGSSSPGCDGEGGS